VRNNVRNNVSNNAGNNTGNNAENNVGNNVRRFLSSGRSTRYLLVIACPVPQPRAGGSNKKGKYD
jgi:hypothetical protein